MKKGNLIFGVGIGLFFLLSAPYAFATELVGSWTFDEGTGSMAYDYSGYGNDGTLKPNYPSDSPRWVSYGCGSHSLEFDGSNDYVVWNYSTTPANDFTISAWVRAANIHEIDSETTGGFGGVSGQRYLFWPDHRGISNAGAGISIGTNGISVYEHGSSYMPAIAVYSGSIGTDWNYITVTYTNKQPRIYLNGTLVHTGLTSSRENVYAPTRLGGDVYGYFKGTIDNVRIYNYALSATEIQQDYREGTSTSPPMAKITSPQPNSLLSGTITILGTATAENFLNYVFQYGTGSKPTAWLTIATSTTIVINGTLATWNTTLLEDGTYTLCLIVKDKSNNVATDTVVVGIDNTSPIARIIFPEAGSEILQETITILGTADDEHLLNWILEYGASYTPQTYTLVASSTISVIYGTLGSIFLPIGSYTLKLTVSDITNNVATDSVSFIIIFPTPAEILQKVDENFAMIEDMRAKMITWGTATLTEELGTLSETLLLEPTERIFMSKPDKMKIEIPAEDTIFIINADKWYMKSPLIGIQEIDTAEMPEIFSTPLSLYSPFESQEGYKEVIKGYVCRDGEDIFTLEITPEVEGEDYMGKIILEVNYNKGVIVKTEVYDLDDEMVLRTEVKEISLFNGDTWLPTEYRETKFADNKLEIVTEVLFSEIELNTGIPDSEFELE